MSDFTVRGKAYSMLDPNKITFAEADALERVTGHSFQEIQSDESLSGSARVVQALLWVSMKRADPELKFSDLNDLAMGDIEWIEEEPAEEPDPTVPAEAGETSED